MILSVGHVSHIPSPFIESLPMTVPPNYRVLIGICSFLSLVSTQVTRVGNDPDTWGRCAICILVPLEGTFPH